MKIKLKFLIDKIFLAFCSGIEEKKYLKKNLNKIPKYLCQKTWVHPWGITYILLKKKLINYRYLDNLNHPRTKNNDNNGQNNGLV
jgi:hypothetical protein